MIEGHIVQVDPVQGKAQEDCRAYRYDPRKKSKDMHTPSEVLSIAFRAGQLRQYQVLWPHARMRERGVTDRCLDIALQTATDATYQPENDRWILKGGVDSEGDPLTLILKLNGVLIITLLGD